MIDTLWPDSAFSARLCLTLLHSLWQVSLLALAAWLVERLARRSVEVGYVVHVTAIITALVALPITFARVPAAVAHPASSVPAAAESTTGTPQLAAAVSTPVTSSNSGHGAATGSSATPPPAAAREITNAIRPSLPWDAVTRWIASVYAAGVVVMLSRLILGLWAARRQARSATPLQSGPVTELLRQLAQQWSLTRIPLLAVADSIVVPHVVGLMRPVILLPGSALTGLSPDELRMVLAHELAHIRRYDLWLNLVQRVAETVLFFNPPLWYLSRRASTLREYCCDELACRSLTSAPRTRYAEALVRIAELSRPTAKIGNELATLAASGRSPSELRRRIARLFGEPVREPLRLSRGSLAAVVIATLLLLLGPTAWRAQTADPAAPAAAKARLELLVVDPDGKPVPRAMVEVRTDPAPLAEDVLVGEFLRPATYGPFVQTDDNGKLVLRHAGSTKRFDLNITTPGYGAYWAGWDSEERPDTVPDKFTAELEAGWSVGGVVVDAQGQPVAGVDVHPNIDFKKRPGDTQQLGVGAGSTTNADGRWRFDSVPVSKSDVWVEINHPDFRPIRRPVTRDEFGLKLDQQPVAKIALDRGLTVTGRITDEQGQPIADALIRTKFMNDIREARTDTNGNYRLGGCEPRMVRIVASATGHATDMQEVRVDEHMGPVDFKMQPGRTVRIRVVDEQGRGIPRARIFFQRWRGMFKYFEFDHVDQYADENGLWVWHEAPVDEFEADICRPDGMELSRRPIIARDEEYVFSPPRALVVSGKVVDANTNESIKKFRVTPGLRKRDPAIGMNWIPSDSYVSTDGTYRVRLTHDYPAHLVKIEADGYYVAISRDIKTNEGEITLDFELQPAADSAATILTPDGTPANGAKIALGTAGTQISLRNGDFNDSTYATRLDTDAEGKFRFSPPGEPFQLVITHPSGYAWLKFTDRKIPDPIRLTAWARVEGVFRVGLQPTANAQLRLEPYELQSYSPTAPHIHTDYLVTTGTEGHYVIDRVVPGKAIIGRNIVLVINEGSQDVTSSVRVRRVFAAGETTKLDLGGNGRAVIGKLVAPPNPPERVMWNFALITAHDDIPAPVRPEPPADVKADGKERLLKWMLEWNATPEGQQWRTAQTEYNRLMGEATYLTATVDRDGAFRIDDVPPGKYVLSIDFNEHAIGNLPDKVHFEVPPGENLPQAPPIDLGELHLK